MFEAWRWGVVRSTLFVVLTVLTLGASSNALAFNNPQDYGKYPLGGDPTLLGGGAGRYYTGSPADAYSCESCHSSRTPYSFPLQLTGLPKDGYVPGQQYKIEISSPQANVQLAQASTSGMMPASSLTAELVAQDGGPAGSISFVNSSDFSPDKFPDQFCSTLAMVDPTKSTDQYGTVLYQVDTGTPSKELTLSKALADPEKFGPCSVEHGTNEDGAPYDRRCVVAMKNCGAKTVKFLWTAPEKWSGPIWFSMGYVATYNLTSQPNDDDYVTTMTVPLNPSYGGPTFETELNSGCSVVAGPRHNMTGRDRLTLTLTLGLAGVLIARRRQRRSKSSSSPRQRALAGLPLRAAAALLALACLAFVGCGNQGKGLVTDVPASVGQYESIGCTKDCIPPLNCRVAAWPDAGTPETVAEAKKAAAMMPAGEATATTGGLSPLAPQAGGAAGALGEAGAGTPANGPKSLGSVTLSFATAQPAGVTSSYAYKCNFTCSPNYLAAWIVDAKEQYVRTMFTQMGTYVVAGLPEFSMLGTDCQSPKEKLPMDAIAMATMEQHLQHTLTWDGLYGNGHIAAPPGVYHLKIEVAIDEMHPVPMGDVEFVFGDPAPYTNIIDPAPSHTAVTLTYTPNL